MEDNNRYTDNTDNTDDEDNMTTKRNDWEHDSDIDSE